MILRIRQGLDFINLFDEDNMKKSESILKRKTAGRSL